MGFSTSADSRMWTSSLAAPLPSGSPRSLASPPTPPRSGRSGPRVAVAVGIAQIVVLSPNHWLSYDTSPGKQNGAPSEAKKFIRAATHVFAPTPCFLGISWEMRHACFRSASFSMPTCVNLSVLLRSVTSLLTCFSSPAHVTWSRTFPASSCSTSGAAPRWPRPRNRRLIFRLRLR